MKPAFKSSDLTVAAPEIYNWRVYILAIVSSMGAFMFGYDLAFIGTAITLKPFIRYLHLTHPLSEINFNAIQGTSDSKAPRPKGQMHSRQTLCRCSRQDASSAPSSQLLWATSWGEELR
jgi:hypothetical protein